MGLQVKFRKIEEIQTLAPIYEHYRGKYNMHYQHPELRYRMDAVIVLEISRSGGLTIEIDEKGHGNYDETSHEKRQKILESCGYRFVRIKPNQYTKKQLINLIDNEIGEYNLLYCNEINVDALWSKLINTDVDKKFFDFIGKSIVSDKKYPVYFDDVTTFLGYSRYNDAIKTLEKKYRSGFDFIELKEAQIKDHKDILSSAYNDIFITNETVIKKIIEVNIVNVTSSSLNFVSMHFVWNHKHPLLKISACK